MRTDRVLGDQDEAIEVWKAQLKGRRSTLKPEHADAREPWSSNMFTASAWNRAVAAICGSASARTRPMYAKGSMDGENWVARWALYHILRYRDDRNKRARSNKFHDDDDRHMQGPLGMRNGAERKDEWSLTND